MQILEREIKGVYEITLCPTKDTRGYFMRTYDAAIFGKYRINRKWVQESHSRSVKKGIIRGLHFQLHRYTETKLVRCVRGSIFDVFVDLRRDSSTFSKWGSLILSEENNKMIYIPQGFAHGFCTLTQISDVVYKMDSFYNKRTYGGIIWNDRDLAIPWPVEHPLLSEKDSKLPSLESFVNKYGGI